MNKDSKRKHKLMTRQIEKIPLTRPNRKIFAKVKNASNEYHLGDRVDLFKKGMCKQ